MGFNYRKERRQFEKRLEEDERRYRAAGMSDSQINAMREYEEEMFRRERVSLYEKEDRKGIVHEATAYLPAEDMKKANQLLKLGSFEELSERERRQRGIEEDSAIWLYEADFDDGSYLICELLSSNCSYWDAPTWYASDSSEGILLDCQGKIWGFDFEMNGERYIVHVKRNHLMPNNSLDWSSNR